MADSLVICLPRMTIPTIATAITILETKLVFKNIVAKSNTNAISSIMYKAYGRDSEKMKAMIFSSIYLHPNFNHI